MKRIATIILVLTLVYGAIHFISCSSQSVDPRGNLYAGSVTCLKCHKEIYNSYLHTAHYVASSPASIKTVHGNFLQGLNVFANDSNNRVVMEKKDSGLYQTYYSGGKVKESQRFDIVFGGIKGESYLYWNGNTLKQLPVSWYSKQNRWLLSPRFDPNNINFNRRITSRCLECHASYIADKLGAVGGLHEAEQFDKSSIVYSIDCERCHGPGAQHADFQTRNPNLKTAKFITSFSALPRQRKMDLCAVCHSGNKSEMTRSTFSFRPGDTLANFKLPDFIGSTDTTHLDVHGNQVQLLESSKCFIFSKMNCATCHDTHQDQRGNTALFTEKCLSCHSVDNHNFCKMANKINAQFIRSNCVQCHMPSLTSVAIVSPDINQTSSAVIMVHTHHIAIYNQEVKKVLAMFGK